MSKVTPIEVSYIFDIETQEGEVGCDENDNEVRTIHIRDHDSNSCLEGSSFEGTDSDDDNIELEYFFGKYEETKQLKTTMTSKFAKTNKKNKV